MTFKNRTLKKEKRPYSVAELSVLDSRSPTDTWMRMALYTLLLMNESERQKNTEQRRKK